MTLPLAFSVSTFFRVFPATSGLPGLAAFFGKSRPKPAVAAESDLGPKHILGLFNIIWRWSETNFF